MKILFVTNHFEPERGGVADYTRLLAKECVRQGHEAALLSLNDHFVAGKRQDSLQSASSEIPILRISSEMRWKDRIRHAKNFITVFSPDWISLQFVCYGFNDKGIVWNIVKPLKEIIDGVDLQIMMHELWIGEDGKASLHDRIYKLFQRYFILRLIRELNPKIVSTQSQAYVSILKNYRIKAKHLPLFGAIPVSQEKENSRLFPKLKDVGIEINDKNRDDYWLFGMFGALHSVWPPEPLFLYLKEAQERYNKKIVILSVGDMGKGKELWGKISERYKNTFSFLELGRQPAEAISWVFNSIDYGIAASPYQLIEKSASVAAMLEHGLPVIVNRDDVCFLDSLQIKYVVDPLIIMMKESLPDILPLIKKRAAHSTLTEIAQQFLKDLSRRHATPSLP